MVVGRREWEVAMSRAETAVLLTKIWEDGFGDWKKPLWPALEWHLVDRRSKAGESFSIGAVVRELLDFGNNPLTVGEWTRVCS